MKRRYDDGRAGPQSYLTPPSLIELLGPFDTDPCVSMDQPWRTARLQYDFIDDGLSQAWQGRVWLNPPYNGIERWIDRFCLHNNGIALVFARIQPAWFRQLWHEADAMLFLFGRILFHDAAGKLTDGRFFPSVLVAIGEENVQKLRQSGLSGAWVEHHQVLNGRDVN